MKYTKTTETRKYTETVYYVDGEEVDRVPHWDDYLYDSTPLEPMTQDEIDDYA